ncbi:hypothetical protein EDC14_104128 [Hydrogenispora ethanolica]|uniref:Outer membrane lipoprotein-sorting protein n=1 Tax=Hydrogenispora ethanolica TaxID=1082276 RepID=A0A4R1R027_HYDET|nr:hypothetical protein [Hydrogenispora ethanolica]TCL58635.1 hypothetical protein EDC14_104128 [Hydrogenispora ethanolica]
MRMRNEKKHLWTLALCLLVSLAPGLILAAGNVPSKEALIESLVRRVQAKGEQLGKYQANMMTTTQGSGRRDFKLAVERRVTYEGHRKTAEQFVKGSVNGRTISESQYNRFKDRMSGGSDHAEAAELIDRSLAGAQGDAAGNRLSWEGTEEIRGIPVFKLKYTPSGSSKFNEAYLYIDQAEYDFVRVQVHGKPNERVQSFKMTIDFQKSLKGYYLPALIHSEAALKTKRAAAAKLTSETRVKYSEAEG